MVIKHNKDVLRAKLIYPKDRIRSFRQLSNEAKADEIVVLPKNIQRKILNELQDDEIVSFSKFLDLDDAVDVLQAIHVDRRKRIILLLEKGAREKINVLLKFDENSVAGSMTLDYVQVGFDWTLKDALLVIERHEKKTGKFPIIFVMNHTKLMGELNPVNISKMKSNSKVSNFITKIPVVEYHLNIKDVPNILKRHSHEKLAVVDEDGAVLGVVFAHDILKLIDESHSIQKFAGVNKEEDVYDTFLEKTKNRHRWLILNLATAFLAASIVGLFEETIATFTLLAIYMPVVAGMGGNAGTQTMAVFIRGIALKEIELNKKALRAIFSEVCAGAMNGLIVGVLASAVALFWNKSAILGLIIGLAMVFNLIIAGFFGALIPLTMKKLGKDPATSATIFITTATDVFGFFVFLGLATLML